MRAAEDKASMSRVDHSSVKKLGERTAPLVRKTSFLAAARDYVRSVLLEMRQVTWPSWKEARSTTAVVIIFTFAMAFYLATVDWICTKLLNLVMQLPAAQHE